jgi:hypothetical protein
MELLTRIAKPRPAGTVQNREITDYIGSYLENLGYETRKLPFNCKVWESQDSYLMIGGNKLTLHVNPFSESFTGTRRAILVRNLEELERVECNDKILFLTEDLAKEPLQRSFCMGFIVFIVVLFFAEFVGNDTLPHGLLGFPQT